MTAKHDFYLARDGRGPARQDRKKAWHNWKGKEGRIEDGIIKPVSWDLPDIVKRAIERLA